MISDEISVNSKIDNHSKRLLIDTSNSPNIGFEKISLNLGISVSDLHEILIDDSVSNSFGSNWLNYDIRSVIEDLEVSSLNDASISLSFEPSNSSITIVNAGELTSEGFDPT